MWSFIAGSTNAPIPARFQASGGFFCYENANNNNNNNKVTKKTKKKSGNCHIIPNIDVFRGRVVRFRKSQLSAACWFREKSPSKKSKDFQRNKRREAETLTKIRNHGRVLHATSHCPLFSIWHLWFKSSIFSLSIQKNSLHWQISGKTFKKKGNLLADPLGKSPRHPGKSTQTHPPSNPTQGTSKAPLMHR